MVGADCDSPFSYLFIDDFGTRIRTELFEMGVVILREFQ